MSTEKPVLAISISTGWAVRNFFQTCIIERLQQSFRLLIYTTPLLHEKLLEYGYGKGIDFIVRNNLDEPLLWKVFRQLKKKIYMESRKSKTEVIWERYVKRPIYQKIGGVVIQAILKIIDANSLLKSVERMDYCLNNCKEVDASVDKFKPAMFFATHASTYFEESIMHSFVNKSVPSIFMILSWDHLSSKVILSSNYASILVWNKITKAEVLGTSNFYQDEQISVVGVPQYDCYREPPVISYQDWCQKYGLNPMRKTLLFSTMPQVRHEQQHIILEELLIALNEGRLPEGLQVLIKCHPFDNSDRYDALLNGKYLVGICRSTLPLGAEPDQWFPSVEEMYVSRDALYFSELNMNIFSTVTLEAAFYDKPIIHIAFDPEPVQNRIPCREYYNFEHFKGITESGASILVENYHELFDAIIKYLDEPCLKRAERKKLVELYFVEQKITASEAVAENIISIYNNLIKH